MKYFYYTHKHSLFVYWCSACTDTERRSQNSYTTPCNGAVSHRDPIGGIWVLPTTQAETNTNKMHPWSSRALQCFTRVYLHAQTTVHTHLTNHGYLKSQEKLKYPQLEYHACIRMEQVLGSPVYICECMLEYWATALQIHTPPRGDLQQAFHRGSINFKWISLQDTPTWKFYTLCSRINQHVAQRVCDFHIEFLNMTIHLKITLPRGMLTINISQGVYGFHLE